MCDVIPKWNARWRSLHLLSRPTMKRPSHSIPRQNIQELAWTHRFRSMAARRWISVLAGGWVHSGSVFFTESTICIRLCGACFVTDLRRFSFQFTDTIRISTWFFVICSSLCTCAVTIVCAPSPETDSNYNEKYQRHGNHPHSWDRSRNDVLFRLGCYE